jgi:hypothetical protein
MRVKTFLQLGLALALAAPAGMAADAGLVEQENVEARSRFVRTAMALTMATEEERAEFASIALSELAVTYLAEADLARRQSRELERGNKLGSWSAGVYGFVDQLVLVQEDIDYGFPVELRHLYGQVIGVVSGGRTVILNHPRSDQQAAYEQRVLADFCGRHDCDRLTTVADGDAPEAIPVTAAGARPEWDFRETGPVCSHRGILLRFDSSARLADGKNLCRQLMQEAESLAAELAWQRRHGVQIDWSRLSIKATPGRPEHIVQLNQAGDSILVPLPLMHSTRGLLQQLEPWLRHRYDSDEPQADVELQAAALGWE